MASSAVNVPDPVSLPTSVQLCQIADNIANVLFTSTQQGKQYLDVYQCIGDLCAAIRCLAQSGLVVNNTTASSVGSVNTRNAYALGAQAAIPTIINTRSV